MTPERRMPGRMSKTRRSEAVLQRRCDQWNDAHPVGVTVEFHPIIGEPEHRLRTTRTPARVLSGHTAVVWLDGENGCVALDACVPTEAAQ
jgi:hypothetical protein